MFTDGVSSAQDNPLRPQVAYLGPIASFSHQAALEYFHNTADLHPRPSFGAIFDALQTPTTSSPQVTHAIVPIENSSNGTVVSLLDLLADPENKYPQIRVCAEYYLSVHHCLLAPPGLDTHGQSTEERLRSIKTLHTHPQVWTQCTKYLSTHLSHAERIDTSSTSAAASYVRGAPTPHSIAAIGSSLAAETNGLEIVAANIEDDAQNTTRFLVLCTSISSAVSPSIHSITEHTSRNKRKSLITFTLDHSRPGSLAEVLHAFGEHEFNLTSIDTRPSRRIAWHYIFCVECEEVHARQGRMDDVLGTLKGRTETCRYLGSWEDALSDTS